VRPAALAFVTVTTSIAVLYLLGARMFASARFGILTAVLLALTPLLWRQAQGAPASLAPLPFVVGWLWAVAHIERADTVSVRWAAAAGGILGLGVYTSLAAIVMMPLYLLLTIGILVHDRALARRTGDKRLLSTLLPVEPPRRPSFRRAVRDSGERGPGALHSTWQGAVTSQ